MALRAQQVQMEPQGYKDLPEPTEQQDHLVQTVYKAQQAHKELQEMMVRKELPAVQALQGQMVCLVQPDRLAHREPQVHKVYKE